MNQGKVIFVAGIAGAGKTTFIKNNFPNYEKLDMFDYQSKYTFLGPKEMLMCITESKGHLIKLIKQGKNVVFESTFLTKRQRKTYLKAIKKFNPYTIIYYLDKSDEEIYKNNEKRKTYMDSYMLEQCREILEIPQLSEGFNEVNII